MTGEFIKYTYPPTGDVILFCKTPDGSIYSRIDNAFAHANGFADLYDMQNKIYEDGGDTLPDWLLWHSGLTNMFHLN